VIVQSLINGFVHAIFHQLNVYVYCAVDVDGVAVIVANKGFIHIHQVLNSLIDKTFHDSTNVSWAPERINTEDTSTVPYDVLFETI
jgi:hypothetical protein